MCQPIPTHFFLLVVFLFSASAHAPLWSLYELITFFLHSSSTEELYELPYASSPNQFEMATEVLSSQPPFTSIVNSLEKQCYLYLIRNFHQIPSSHLALLPQAMRYKLLRNLPAVDVWLLETTEFVEGLDSEKVWKVILKNRCTVRMPFVPRTMSFRDRYFAAVWKTLLSTDLKLQDPTLSSLLYDVRCVLEDQRVSLSEWNYRLPHMRAVSYCSRDSDFLGALVYPRDSITVKSCTMAAIIQYFLEVCLLNPNEFVVDCILLSRYFFPVQLEKPKINTLLQNLLSRVERLHINGHGFIPKISYSQRRTGETRHSQLKMMFLLIPKHFVAAAINNTSSCKLYSIRVDAGDISRTAAILNMIKENGLSNNFKKLKEFSVVFTTWVEHYKHYFSTALEIIRKLVESQPHLHSLLCMFPAETRRCLSNTKKIPSLLEMNKPEVESFTACLQEFLKRPQFKCLVARNMFLTSNTQQLIRTFLSLSDSSHNLLLDLCTRGEKWLPQPLTQSSHTFGKVLKIGGSYANSEMEDVNMTKWFFQLPNVVLDDLHVKDTPNNIAAALHGDITFLVKKMSIIFAIDQTTLGGGDHSKVDAQQSTIHPRYIHRPNIWMHSARRSRVPQKSLFSHASGNHQLLKAVDITLPPDYSVLFMSSALQSLTIKFEEESNFLKFGVNDLLQTIAKGLEQQALICSLNMLELPTLDLDAVDDSVLMHCLDVLFVLPQLESFELRLSTISVLTRISSFVSSSWSRVSGGRMLGVLSLRKVGTTIIHVCDHSDLVIQLQLICKNLQII